VGHILEKKGDKKALAWRVAFLKQEKYLRILAFGKSGG